MGDGGSGGDPGNRAQRMSEKLGKLLRILREGLFRDVRAACQQQSGCLHIAGHRLIHAPARLDPETQTREKHPPSRRAHTPAASTPDREIDCLNTVRAESAGSAQTGTVDRVNVCATFKEQLDNAARPSDHSAMERRASRTIPTIHEVRVRIQQFTNPPKVAGLRSQMNRVILTYLSRRSPVWSTASPFENRRDLIEGVLAQRADVGIAWDGDADRCFFVDGAGDFVPGDFVTALLAEAFLLKSPGATIIYDVRASHAVRDVVARYGGRALRNRVGHAFFKRRMREENAVFGGEVTGHYYFRENFYADNGFIPALLILELMSKKQQSLRELLEPLNAKYFISGEINTKVGSIAVVEDKLKTLASRYATAELDWLDGISVDYPDWHFNVRPSNTEPLLRLNLEANSQSQMIERRDEVLQIIRS
jgi:hypothetical protein